MARILLAEDDDAMRQFLVAALSRAGHTVSAHADGLAAAAALPAPMDLLVADIVMPGLDGVELARRASHAKPGLPVLFVTGFASSAVSGGEPPLPNAVVLFKPFKLRDLMREVDKLLAN